MNNRKIDYKPVKKYAIHKKDTPKNLIRIFDKLDDAIQYVKDHREEENGDLYWKEQYIHYYTDTETGEKIGEFDSMSERFAFERKCDREYTLSTMNLVGKIKYILKDKLEDLKIFVEIYTIDKFSRVYDQIKWGFQRMFRGYDDRATWNVDIDIIDRLQTLVPVLKDNLHGYPTEYEKKADELIAAGKVLVTNNEGSDYGMYLWKRDLEDFVEHIKLYKFYLNMCEEDENDGTIGFSTKYRVPYIHEYNCVDLDFDALTKLTEEHWTIVMDFIKEHLRGMWD